MFLSTPGIPQSPTNLAITTDTTDFSLNWTFPVVRTSENLTFIVSIENTVTDETWERETATVPFRFGDAIGERNCEAYQFTIISVNQVGRSTAGVFGSEEVPTGMNACTGL